MKIWLTKAPTRTPTDPMSAEITLMRLFARHPLGTSLAACLPETPDVKCSGAVLALSAVFVEEQAEVSSHGRTEAALAVPDVVPELVELV